MDYLELAGEIAQRGTAAGVEAEVFIRTGKKCEIKVNQGEVQKLSQAGSKGLGVRVIDGGRVGYAYTSDLSDLQATWQSAMELAQVADRDSGRMLPAPHPVSDEDLDIYDPAVETTPIEVKITLTKAMERAALDYDERVVAVDWLQYEDEVEHVYLVNSRGFAGEYARSIVIGDVSAIGRDADGQTSGWGFSLSPHLADLDPQAVGVEAARKAIDILGAKPVETQRATVVFDPTTAVELVAGLSRALTAEAMQRSRSFLLNKMGQDVAADIVSLLDNGRLRRGVATTPFDGEGVPTSATKLIDEGILQAVIHDSYTAIKDGTNSTGNARRGSHREMARLAPSNFYLQPGPDSPEAIIAGVERGLYVTNAMNTGGVNPINGDFSIGVSGRWIENGRLTSPVTGVTVGSTLPEILRNIVAVGSDLRFLPSRGIIGSPTIRVEGMTIAGRN